MNKTFNKYLAKVWMGMLCLMAMLPATYAQEQFNDIDDILYLGDTALVCSFQDQKNIMAAGTGASAGSTYKLDEFDRVGHPARKVYFFGEFTGSTLLNLANKELIFGDYMHDESNYQVTGLAASQDEFLGKVVLSWNEVQKADGYLIFRNDHTNNEPYARTKGSQLTTFTDDNVGIGASYIYYVVAYSLQKGQRFISAPASIDGSVRPFTFSAATDNEAVVEFEWEFDNHLIVGLEEQAAYLEIIDETSGEEIHADEVTLTDIAEDALLFDVSLLHRGDGNNGVYSQPNIGNLNSWTLEFWVNLTDSIPFSYEGLFESGNAGAGIQSNGRLFIYDYNGNSTFYWMDGNPIKFNKWTHLAFSCNGHEITVFVDGSPIRFNGVSTLPFAESLNNNLKFGQYASNWGSIVEYLKGAMGMIRVWDVDRTKQQIKDDYKDLFDRQAPGLIAQWTFPNEVLAPIDHINGHELTMVSTNATYPLRWVPSLDFVNPLVTFHHTHWMDRPQPQDAERVYTINLYEVGTGKLITTNNDKAVYSHPGKPALSITEPVVAGNHPVRLSFTPTSVYADAYIIQRNDVLTGESRYLTKVQIPNYLPGDSSMLSPLVFSDLFNYNNDFSAEAGRSYTYSVTPYYKGMDFSDSTARRTVAHNTFDYGFSAIRSGNGVDLSWSTSALNTYNYDTVRIERNGEVLKVMESSIGAYQDTLMLFGEGYQYDLVMIKNGEKVYSQRDSVKLDANGSYTGQMVSQSGDYVVPNKDFWLLKKIETAIYDTIGRFTTDAYGRIDISNIPYGRQAEFYIESTSGKNILHNDFTLTRAVPYRYGALIKYDTVFEKTEKEDLFTVLDTATGFNSLTLSWDMDTSLTTATHFTNIYRDGVLIDIVNESLDYKDSTATTGNHEYSIVSYYFSELDGELNYLESSTSEFTFPSIEQAIDFDVNPTASLINKVTWKYLPDAPFKSFVVSRVMGEDKKVVVTVSRILSNGATPISYSILDSMGYPGALFDYELSLVTAVDDTLTIGLKNDVVFPDISLGDVMTASSNSVKTSDIAFGAYYQANVSSDRLSWPSWNGFALYSTTDGALIPFNKDLNTGGNYTLAHPGVEVDGGLSLMVYKHTDYGTYLSDTTSGMIIYSGAKVRSEGSKPSQPTLTTSADQLPTPVLHATKDLRGKIYVDWTYPHYTTMTFELQMREYNVGGWTTVVLKNEERAYLVDNTGNKTMEFKLKALREGGEESDQVWDYGVSKSYFQFEGLVFDTNKLPLPEAFVGIDGHWVKTDGAGFYSLKNIELPYGATSLQYIVPGEKTIRNIPLTISANEQVYQQNIFASGGNDIMAPDFDFADVYAISGEADTATLTNKIRWKSTNDKFTGFKVYRGLYQVASVNSSESMIFVDSLDDLSIAGATYSVVPYFKNALGEEIENESGGKEIDLDFPVLEEPLEANALADLEQGYVKLTWAHRKLNVDGFIVERDDEIIGVVGANEKPEIIDSTGIPHHVYRYNIYSYLLRSGGVVKSLRSRLLESQFPKTGNPTDLYARTGTLPDNSPENYVEVSWDYPTESQVEGAALFRGLDSIGYVSYPDTMVIDSTGIPETFTTYYVKTYDEKEGGFYASSGAMVNAVYPKLQDPINFSVTNVNFDTVWVRWDYVSFCHRRA